MPNSNNGFDVYNPNLQMGNLFYAFQQNIPNQYGIAPYDVSQQLGSMQDINSMFNNTPAPVSPTPTPAATPVKTASSAKSVSFDTLMNNVMKEITNITMLKCG